MNIFRYYHQNRKVIWIIIMAIIILIIALQTFNTIVKNQQNNKNENNSILNQKDYENNLNINIVLSNEDVIQEEKLIIDQFIRYCNAKKVEEAYALLTDNCKEQLFPTIEYFKQNYYHIHFSTTKLYSKEHFSGNTYKIKLYEDILSTGSINTNGIEDYYTIEKQNGITKLNINNYIGMENINKSNTNENFKIKVVKKQIYKEYEQYEIQVTNLTYQTILLDSKKNTKTMYLEGENSVNYYSLSHEILINDLMVKPKATVTIFIKYSKEYASNKTVNKVVFSDIILDYEAYQNENNKEKFQNRTNMLINI